MTSERTRSGSASMSMPTILVSGIARNAKVIHLLPPRYNVDGRGWGWDAIQAVTADQARSVVMVYRAMGDAGRKVIRPRGLKPGAVYRVLLEDSGSVCEASGDVLARQGIQIELAEMSAEIIRFDVETMDAHNDNKGR